MEDRERAREEVRKGMENKRIQVGMSMAEEEMERKRKKEEEG